MIEWLTGPHDDWAGIAIAVGIAVVVAYAVAILAGRLAAAPWPGSPTRTVSPAADRGRHSRPRLGPAGAGHARRGVRGDAPGPAAAAGQRRQRPRGGSGEPRGVHRLGDELRAAHPAGGAARLPAGPRPSPRSTARLEAQVLSGGGPDRLEHIKRARTLGRLVKNALTALVVGVATLTILRELNVDIMPLLTGAGIVGLAVGFGAQTLVKDLISGVFLISTTTSASATSPRINGTGGLVEAINLRTIVLRDHEGTVHVFPNGGITTLSNLTKDFAYAVVDVGVGYAEDADRVVEVLRAVGAEVAAEPRSPRTCWRRSRCRPSRRSATGR